MKLRAAFIFLAPETDGKIHRTTIDTPAVEVITVGVPDYAAAEIVAKELIDAGIGALELCAGFGNEGVARISKVAGDKAAVGAVRFDHHPGLEYKSGDALFQ